MRRSRPASSVASPAVTPHPAKLGKYDIVRVVGTGSMGVVYEGFDPVIQRTLAIKTIRKDALDPHDAEEHSRRFLIEARAAGKLNHPNIVAIYDFVDEQGQSYIVMEFVRGKELKSFFDAKHVFTPPQTLRLVRELLDALGYSHRQGVIHRDVKPANLFVTQAGSLKLGDFGIARIESTQKTHDGTMLGTALGTPSYMSPEQVRGETADARSDLYSAGVILYQFLVGEKPFTGSMVAVMQKVLNEAPPTPSSIDARWSPAVDAVVARALAKRREDRFDSADAFREALEGALGTSESKGDADATLMIPPGIARAPLRRSAGGETATGEITAGSASLASGAWASTSWVGTQPGDGGAAATGSGLSSLRQRAEEARRSAQEKTRHAEREAERVEQARQEREQAAQSRLKALGETATAQLGNAAELADAVRALPGSAGLLVDASAMLQELQVAIDEVENSASTIREFAVRESLSTAAKSDADALCSWVHDETERLRATHREVDAARLGLRDEVNERLARLEALDWEGRQAEDAARTRLAALEGGGDAAGLAAAERAVEDLCTLARRCEATLGELGRVAARLPPADMQRLDSAAQALQRLQAAAAAAGEALAAAQRNAERQRTARTEAERRARADEHAPRAAEQARHAAASDAAAAEIELQRVARETAERAAALQSPDPPGAAAAATQPAAARPPVARQVAAPPAAPAEDAPSAAMPHSPGRKSAARPAAAVSNPAAAATSRDPAVAPAAVPEPWLPAESARASPEPESGAAAPAVPVENAPGAAMSHATARDAAERPAVVVSDATAAAMSRAPVAAPPVVSEPPLPAEAARASPEPEFGAATAAGAPVDAPPHVEARPNRGAGPSGWLMAAGTAAVLTAGTAWYVVRSPASPQPGAPAAVAPATPVSRTSLPAAAAPTVEARSPADPAKEGATAAERAEPSRAMAERVAPPAATAVGERQKTTTRVEPEKTDAFRPTQQERAATPDARRAEQERAAAAAANDARRLAGERAGKSAVDAARARDATAPARGAVALPGAAQVPAEQGAPQQALAPAQRATPNNPAELVNASLRRAETALEQLNFDAARSHLEGARRIDPGNARAARLMQQIGEREIRYLREETVIK